MVFALLTWGLVFLIADAKIFGCSARSYVEALKANAFSEAGYVLKEEGTLKIRNVLLRWAFFRDLFGCYFCTGVWCGPLAHLLLRFGSPEQQLITHANTASGWATGIIIAAALGGACSYLIDVTVGALEHLQS